MPRFVKMGKRPLHTPRQLCIADFHIPRYGFFDFLDNPVKEYHALADIHPKMEKVIAARNGGYAKLNTQEKLEANAELSSAIRSINIVAEQYPQLKANENFIELNSQLKKTEEDIANARKYYNAVVKSFNNKVEMFPSSIIASIFRFDKKQMFVVDDETERSAVKVEF